MDEITIYGASDDLIEIEGSIREEFSFFPDNDKEGRLLAVSDGTLLRVNYDSDGIWRITPLMYGTAKYSKVEGDVAKDTPDRVTLKGNINWIAFAEGWAKR